MTAPIRVVAGLPGGATSAAVHSTRMLRNLLVPMRDGVRLAMDIVRPKAAGRYPVVLMRTPYNKIGALGSGETGLIGRLARAGYVVAAQDCRGRFNSDGEFDPYRQEHADGFDTVQWIAEQDWCDGNVGMIGGSYIGQTQWLAASQAPPALKAIVPSASPPGHPFLNEPFWGGAVLLSIADWMVMMGRRCEMEPGMRGLNTGVPDHYAALPLADVEEMAGVECGWWREWLSRPVYDDYWRSHGYEEQWPAMTVPALNVTGWWDMNFPGAARNFVGMRAQGATAEARDGQRLVIGPWAHWLNKERSLSGVHFGAHALVDLDGYTHRFFDHWLKGAANRLESDSKVHVFVIGANRWWEADNWPLPGTVPTAFYLHSDGAANSHHGDGTLSPLAPADEPADRFVSDPLDPVSATWTMHDGPVDDRPLSTRGDVLCYTSEPLEAPLHVVGEVRAVLFAASSALDCDWHARLVDVDPSGAARFLCHGVLRARFRNGFEQPVMLEPGQVERFEIDMAATGIRFAPGHRVRVEIASSWFSRFDRNPQNGSDNWMVDRDPPCVAEQQVHHDARHPSQVILPVITDPPR